MDEHAQPMPQQAGPGRSGYQSFCLFAAWIIGILCVIDFAGLCLTLRPVLESFLGKPYRPMSTAQLDEALAAAGICALESAGLLALWVIVLGMGRIDAHLSRSR